MRAILVIVVAVAIIVAAHSHSTAQPLQTTPAQAYNSACLAYGNEVPCNLVR